MKFKICLAIGVFSAAFLAVGIAGAQNSEALKNIQYPVAELGSCENQDECKKYCNDLSNASQCLAFAEKHKLISKEEAVVARKIGGKPGPGGCAGKQECDAYCDKAENLDECIVFAEKNGLISKRKAEIVKQNGGEGPGGCKSDKECRAYCENGEHIDECVEFGVKNGMISKEEAEMIKKTGGKGPGGCQGKQQCDAYCQQEEHMDECMDFGIKHGMVSKEEAKMIKKTGGKGPGGCRSKEQCDAYCQQEEHMDECVEFGVKHGMISKEEAEMAKKMKGMPKKGPGGCEGREQCDAYCDNPEHMNECIDFSVANGMMPEEEARRIKDDFKKFGPPEEMVGPGGCKGPEECKFYCDNPDHQEECMKFSMEKGMMPPEEMQKIQMIKKGGPGGCINKEECESFCNKPENSRECMLFAEEAGMFIPKDMPMKEGPGGCSTPEECEKYCKNNQEECLKWGAQGKLPGVHIEPPRQGEMPKGPGGCVDPRECKEYCEQSGHLEECVNFVMPARPGDRGGPTVHVEDKPFMDKGIRDIEKPPATLDGGRGGLPIGPGDRGGPMEIMTEEMKMPGAPQNAGQIQMKRIDGGVMPIDVDGNPILDADGNPIIFVKPEFEKPPLPEGYGPPMPHVDGMPAPPKSPDEGGPPAGPGDWGGPTEGVMMIKPQEYVDPSASSGQGGEWTGEKPPMPATLDASQGGPPTEYQQQWTESQPMPMPPPQDIPMVEPMPIQEPMPMPASPDGGQGGQEPISTQDVNTAPPPEESIPQPTVTESAPEPSDEPIPPTVTEPAPPPVEPE